MDAETICQAVCAYHQTDFQTVAGISRAPHIVWVRAELMYVLHQMTGSRQAEIGAMLGGRDHQTVSHSVNKVGKRMMTDSEYRTHIASLLAFVRAQDVRPLVMPVLDRARRIVSDQTLQPDDVQHCGLALLSAASVLASPDLTDAEARRAALQIMGAPSNG